MSTQTVPRARKSGLFSLRRPSGLKKSTPADDANAVKPTSPEHTDADGGERTVKKLRLSKAVTVPERTTVSEACRRMAARRVDAVLVTDAAGLLAGIVTDKDIAIRVIAEGLRPDQTIISKIMTRNPESVSSGSRAIEALQKMVEGKFRHLPVVENGEIIGLLDVTKCLYDAISRMEKAAEQGSAIAAAVEGVERQWGSNFSAQYAFIETLRERMFKPSLSSIISDSPKVATVLPTDPVYVAARRMRELQSSSVIIVSGGKPLGILTSRDILMRVVAQHISPELTLVEKVMTSNPECASVDTSILDALQILHDRKFLHIPVLDKEGFVVACLDVLQLTHAALSSVGRDGGINGVADTMMQKFWDSVLSLDPPDNEHETCSEASAFVGLEGAEEEKSGYPSLSLHNSFAFKFKDHKGRVHRLNSGSEDLGVLVSAVAGRTGVDITHLLYDDDEGDRVLLSDDIDLAAAVNHAKASGKKVLRLYLDYSEEETAASEIDFATTEMVGDSGRLPSSRRLQIFGSAVVIASITVMFVYMRHSKSKTWL